MKPISVGVTAQRTGATPARVRRPTSSGRLTAKARLLEAWSSERSQARVARERGDLAGEWSHLERAHILSQPMVVPHVRTHLAMISCAFRRRDGREVAGQLMRLVLAAPGSLTGRYPVGNTGGADVSAFLPMPIPDDLRAILDDARSQRDD